MKIEMLGTETTESTKRVCAHVRWEECDRTPCDIYFETDRRFADSLECNPHAFLVGCIIPAFYYGEKRIFVDEEICPVLRDGLMTALTWIRHWFYPADRELIRIEAKVSSYGPRQKKEERAGLLFSGGVDSLTVLRWNRLNVPLEHPASIREAVLILWHHNEAPQTRRDIEDQMSVVAEDAEVELVPIGTNILSSIVNDVPWLYQWQGSVLAAVAHTLAGRLTQVSIAATLDISHMRPLGSHPVLDPNYGSSDLRIRHDGITLSRLAKTKLVAEWDTALQNLRVCNMVPQTGKTPGGTLNCGKCEKCLRTMLALVALGALHKTRAFPGRDVSADSVRELVHLDGTLPYLAYNYEELIAPLLDGGRIDLVLAIKGKLREYRRDRKVAEWKSRVKHLDRKFLGGGLAKIKRAVLS